MRKVYGIETDYALVRQDESRIIVSMGLAPDADGVHCTWYEHYWYKKQCPIVTIDMVMKVFTESINDDTDRRILNGYSWRGFPVWLSSENQFNFKAAYDLAVQKQGGTLPVMFKLGTDKEPMYHRFDTLEELEDFYVGVVQYINRCLEQGWARKDAIDYSEYEGRLCKLYDTEHA